jgi:hypothetical protein
VNGTTALFELEEVTRARPRKAVPKPVVAASEDDITGVSGAALWGPLLDRLNVVGLGDEVGLRPIGPGGYTGGECLRALTETLLAGGDVHTDVDVLRGEATQRLRGPHALPSHDTLWRVGRGAELGRWAKAGKGGGARMARAWAGGGAPAPGVLTIDPDATLVATYGLGKEGSTFSHKHGEVGLHPLVGVFGETGEVCAVRNRAGNANDPTNDMHSETVPPLRQADTMQLATRLLRSLAAPPVMDDPLGGDGCIAPGIFAPFPTACGRFPFRLGREASAKPVAVRPGAVPRRLGDRVIGVALRNHETAIPETDPRIGIRQADERRLFARRFFAGLAFQETRGGQTGQVIDRRPPDGRIIGHLNVVELVAEVRVGGIRHLGSVDAE